MKKLKYLLLALFLLAGAAWTGRESPLLKNIAWPGKSQDKKIQAQDYEFVPVKARDIRRTVMATGTVTLKTGAEVKIGARISGQLKKLNVRIGDFVHAGDVIAVIDHVDLLARLAQRRASLQNEEADLAKTRSQGPLEIQKAKAEIEELEAQEIYAGKTLERNRGLNQQGMVPDSTLDESVQNVNVLKARIKVSRENLKLAEDRLLRDITLGEAKAARARADLQEAETLLSYATITAPIDGIAAFISTQEGETVVASLSAPTFVTLTDLRKLEVTVYVDETDIGQVAAGQKAVFTVDSHPDKFFPGTVLDIHPKAVIKDNVVNYEVMLEIDPANIQLLRPEMTTNVVITTGVRENVLAAPKEAVRNAGKQNFIIAKANNALSEKTVTVGWRDSGFVEIVSGLEPSDQVGIPIKPANAAASERGGGGGPRKQP
ncbi:MAG: efflux RND transporter periplasmic adaptor subunit [Nitrospinae bacterium]|nr:efflux RND transporter periplasmic adaptor subunit [Nitrospinota bacterium]